MCLWLACTCLCLWQLSPLPAEAAAVLWRLVPRALMWGFSCLSIPYNIQSIGLSSFVLLKLLDVLDSAGSTLFFFWPFHNWLCTISIICQGKTSLTALYSVINPSHLPVKIVFLAGSLPFAPLTLVWCPGSSCQVPSAPPGFGNENTL